MLISSGPISVAPISAVPPLVVSSGPTAAQQIGIFDQQQSGAMVGLVYQ